MNLWKNMSRREAFHRRRSVKLPGKHTFTAFPLVTNYETIHKQALIHGRSSTTGRRSTDNCELCQRGDSGRQVRCHA